MPRHSALILEPDLSSDDLDPEMTEIACWTDGLITSAAIGPRGVSASEWMSVVWHRLEDLDEMEWMKSPLEIMLLGAWHDVADTMRADPLNYVPKFAGRANEVAGARTWAEGFGAGMALRSTAWRVLANDTEHRQYLAPIVLLFLDDRELRDVLRPQVPWRPIGLAETRQECASEIVEAVAGIYHYWHGRRGAPVYTVGRNDPCPCGSGRKYKKCCQR